MKFDLRAKFPLSGSAITIEKDIKKFSELLKQEITEKIKSLWFPEWKRRSYKDEAFINES